MSRRAQHERIILDCFNSLCSFLWTQCKALRMSKGERRAFSSVVIEGKP
jgi:hypothetical protein